LALFEALRGLRDAVAPTEATTAPATSASAGACGASGSSSDPEPDYDEFLIAFADDEPHALDLVAKAEGGRPPKTREEYVKLLAKTEMDKDMALVSRLSEEILAKSDAIEESVSKLPGMERTKSQQMKRIEELLELNQEKERELKEMRKEAKKIRDKVRVVLKDVTCDALGIEMA